jgi:hypothetical protein
MWKRNQRLFEEQGDNGGTGGGGAAALTAEDVARIANQAVTAQLKRELPKAFEGFLPSFTKAIDDKLASFKPTEQPADEKNKGASPELSALQRQIAELTEANRLSNERALSVEKKAREDTAFSELKAALGGHIKPEFIDPIAKSLYYADKRVEFSEDGKPLFRAMVPQYTGGPLQEMLLPLKDGIEAYAKSKEAEAYRPAPTAKTPNAPPPRIPSSGGTQMQNNGGKVPTVNEDPTWASRMAAELTAQGVPTGSLD